MDSQPMVRETCYLVDNNMAADLSIPASAACLSQKTNIKLQWFVIVVMISPKDRSGNVKSFREGKLVREVSVTDAPWQLVHHVYIGH